jgi:two-component system, NtrC family, response regulator
MAKVLIIDDDYQYADMLMQHVLACGHEVTCCGTLEDGLAAVITFAPGIVLLDVGLPDGNGLERLRAIKEAPCSPEIIIITGVGNQEGAEVAVRSGAWDYWQKGRSVRGIVPALCRALDYRAARLARRKLVLNLDGLVGRSKAMATCFEFIDEASGCDAPVLLRGETGTGKEVMARSIHKNSARSKGPFIVVDCASLTETLVGSSLFGHDKGAFTGASSERAGLIRQAHEGTLFLDEIGELPLTMQKSFLRVLQERRFHPVGSDHEVSSDFRLLAATNRNIDEMVRDGKFREDLYFRLRSLEITLPPLRTRAKDVLEIAEHVVIESCAKLGISCKGLSSDLADALEQYPWPGNVRELRQSIECAIASAGDSPTLEPIHLPVQVRVHLARASIKPELNLRRPQPAYASYRTLSAVRDSAIAAYLTQLITDTQGNVEAACELAGVSRSRLYELLKLHGVGRTALARKSEVLIVFPEIGRQC